MAKNNQWQVITPDAAGPEKHLFFVAFTVNVF